MILPYWNTDLDLEIASWFPLGLDYHPVSSHQFAGPQVQRISELCLAAGSELLFMSSFRSGCVGSLVRDSFYKEEPVMLPLLGMILILGYSPKMERLVVETINEPVTSEQWSANDDENNNATLESAISDNSLSAGVAFCSLWRRPFGRRLSSHASSGVQVIFDCNSEFGTVNNMRDMQSDCDNTSDIDNSISEHNATGVRAGVFDGSCLVGSMKAIVLVSDNLFFNDSEFLDRFEAKLNENVNSRLRKFALYAEKFGYRRFTMSYDTDNPIQLRISQLLYEMEFAQTRQIVGPAPEAQFPGSSK